MKSNSVSWFAYAALGLGVLCVLTAAAGAIGHRLGLLHYSTGLDLLRWGATLAAVGGAFALLTLLVGLARRASPKASAAALLGLACAVAVLLPAYLFKSKAQSVPPIHDITTDTGDPPNFIALLPEREAAPNGAAYGGPEIARQQHSAYPDIQPVLLEEAKPAAFERALTTARAMGWQIASADPQNGRIEAVATTFFFGFKDDVVIRIREHGPQQSMLDIRSASRVGRSDVGANAERIRKFREGFLAR